MFLEKVSMIKKKVLKLFLLFFEVVLFPFILFSGIVLKIYRRFGPIRLPKNTFLLKKVGIYPLRNHYYEPRINYDAFDEKLSEERFLPGLDLRVEDQIQLLDKLNYQKDFENFLLNQNKIDPELVFTFKNGMIDTGDAEFLFNYIRHLKPSRVIEIGCGSSTKIISHALSLNDKKSEHICIEPYEQPWLEKMDNIKVFRQALEEIELKVFDKLDENDFLFIDTSHMIRPQGDVLREYLEVIPRLKAGVHIHVHDIFTPNDYPKAWLDEHMLFWNEQYILEALLHNKTSYEIVAGLNFLAKTYYDELKRVCPYLTPERQPGSFYFKKIS